MNNLGFNWTPTIIALPSQEGNYLITTFTGSIDMAYWDGASWIKSLTYRGPNNEHTVTTKTSAHLIIAWAYLPEPYKEIKEEVIALTEPEPHDEVKKMPTEDIVEVVRCKDCEHCSLLFGKRPLCLAGRAWMPVTENDFCAWGKKRANDAYMGGDTNA